MRVSPRVVLLTLYATVALLTTIYIAQRNYASSEATIIVPVKRKDQVTVYTATTYFGSQIQPPLADCKDYKDWCRFTNDPVLRFSADAVLFHAKNFALDRAPRRPEQIYVWFTQESSANEEIDIPTHYINWTMTYRTDSDIWLPYNQIEAVPGLFPDLDRLWASKSKEAAWLASNCVTDNRRAEMIRLLSEKGFKTDIWGKCGAPLPSCSRFVKDSNCRTKAMRPYKFYLALENSNCMDYVTEKFWNSLYDYEAVPIVIKRSYYHNYEIPDSAFIAIEDFDSLEKFIEHLHEVSQNKTAYLEHHQWRRTHKMISSSANTGFCELCRRLREQQNSSSPTFKSYRYLSEWFSPRQCEQRLLDKYLGGRTVYDRLLCNFYRFIKGNHWDCS